MKSKMYGSFSVSLTKSDCESGNVFGKLLTASPCLKWRLLFIINAKTSLLQPLTIV
jgi:hypothetical protein